MAEEAESYHAALEAAVATGSCIYVVFVLMGVLIQLALCLYALWSFGRKPSGFKGKRARLLLVSFGIWVLYSIAASTDTWNIIANLTGSTNAYPPWSRGVSSGATLAYIIIGDGLMLWRCYAVWNGQRWVVLVPGTLLFTSLTFGILSVLKSQNLSVTDLVVISWVAFSVATNIVITSLIVAKLLQARREVVKSQMYDNVPRLYRDMIVILVESAAPLALTGLCSVIASAIRICDTRSNLPGLYLFDLVTHVLFLLFAALSPQMILFRTLVFPPRGPEALDATQSNGAMFSHSAQFSTVHYIDNE